MRYLSLVLIYIQDTQELQRSPQDSESSEDESISSFHKETVDESQLNLIIEVFHCIFKVNVLLVFNISITVYMYRWMEGMKVITVNEKIAEGF